MRIFQNKTIRSINVIIILLTFILNLYGCSSENTTKIMQSTNYTLPKDTPFEDIHQVENNISSPLVTNKIPDNNMYPSDYAVFSQTSFIVKHKIYFISNATLYEATQSDEQENWNTKSLEINNISDMSSDGTYLYCLLKDHAGLIYDPETHKIISSAPLPDDGFRRYLLNCVGNQKCYLSSNNNMISFDQEGNVELIKTFDNSTLLRPVYSDSEYFVYISYQRDKEGECHVYVQNLQTNETYSIYDKSIANMYEARAPFYRRNNSFVFFDNDGICVANVNGDGIQHYQGDVSHGYAMYQNKMYFAGSKLFSFDLDTGEQKTYSFSDDDNFTGSLNIDDGYILLSRTDVNSKIVTINVIPVP